MGRLAVACVASQGAGVLHPSGMTSSARSLAGKTALVTGGGSGIGLACARHLLRDGAVVTIAGRSPDKLAAAAAALDSEVEGAAPVRTAVCDVTDEAAVDAAVATAAAGAGGLDIAVANAGSGAAGSVLTTSVDEFRFTLEVNLIGTFLTIKHAAKAMAARGGAIAAISSIAGVLTHRFMSAYCASKAGLEMLVRCAADELGPLHIRVNAVRPGLVPTDLAVPLTADKTIVDDYFDQMPLGQLADADDVAEAVRFLVGPESKVVTGQVFAVDGGHTLRRGPRVDTMVETFFGPEAVAVLKRARS
jgi:NAD(P)-dependent dehydrogenase (short-subunit alcohol dehydrogenase family)